MKAQTFSVIAGTMACNATCPFCVAKMTPTQSINKKVVLNKRNLKIACRLAEKADVTTALITGKGEPTLYPKMISSYLTQLSKYFPLIELQTNGLILATTHYDKYLQQWYKLGLTTIALSVVHYNDDRNGEIYTPNKKYINLVTTINKLHKFGFSVRLSVVALKGYISTPKEMLNMIKFAKKNNVEQLTIRAVTTSTVNSNNDVTKWIKLRSIEHYWEVLLAATLKQVRSHHIANLTHGGKVYDIGGQNVCFYNCLTIDPNDKKLRQLIFFPDGTITHDWNYKGARIL